MSGLFARNFDCELEGVTLSGDPQAGAGGPATITVVEAEMMAEQAKKQGYEEGMIAGTARALSEERASRQARSDEALAVLAEGFSTIARRDQRLRNEVELEIAELVTVIGERILPDLFDTHISDLLIGRLRTGLKLASGEGQVAIRIPPELEEVLKPQIDALVAPLTTETTKFKTIADPQIEDGTLRVDWRNGFLEYDPALASEEAMDTLKEAIVELKSQLETMA